MWRSLGFICFGVVIGVSASTLWHRADRSVISADRSMETAERHAPADSTAGVQRPLDEIVEEAEQMYTTLAQDVRDYTAVLTKQERVEGVLGERQRIELKVQHLPTSGEAELRKRVYLRFLEPESVAGREVIWGSDLNDGKLVAHEGGLLGMVRVSLDPDGAIAMRGQKHPIDRVGITTLAESLIRRGMQLAEAGETIVTEAERIVGDVRCRNIIVATAGSPLGLSIARIEVSIDPERNIPVRYAAYGPPTNSDPMPIEEVYEYTDVKLNVGLTADDFDPDNPAYEFP